MYGGPYFVVALPQRLMPWSWNGYKISMREQLQNAMQ
jgi:hypothetical protein